MSKCHTTAMEAMSDAFTDSSIFVILQSWIRYSRFWLEKKGTWWQVRSTSTVNVVDRRQGRPNSNTMTCADKSENSDSWLLFRVDAILVVRISSYCTEYKDRG